MNVKKFLISVVQAMLLSGLLPSHQSLAAVSDDLNGYTTGCRTDLAIPPVHWSQHLLQNCPDLEGTWSKSGQSVEDGVVFKRTITWQGNKIYKFCSSPEKYCDNDSFLTITFDTNGRYTPGPLSAATICNDVNTVNFILYHEQGVHERHEVKLLPTGDLELHSCTDYGGGYKVILKKNP